MTRIREWTAAAAAAAVVAASLSTGCSGYYTHAVIGGLKVLKGRRPVVEILADPTVADELKIQLRRAARVREFAILELDLPDNKSYRKYKDLGRQQAAWTVVATPELSMEPVVWCFPVAGCVSYRGYFSHARAERFAAKLRNRGLEVDVGGVRAYSTLGWFADPLLNTFIGLHEAGLVGLIVHELAHQRLYLKGDTAFNESFATAVELAGVKRWLEAEGSAEELQAYLDGKRREQEFVGLVRSYRDRLVETYAAERGEDWKRRKKARLFAGLRGDYGKLKQSWGGAADWDSWFDAGLNNARVASLGTYYDHLPAFLALVDRCAGAWRCFFEEVEKIAGLETQPRAEALALLAARSRPPSLFPSIDQGPKTDRSLADGLDAKNRGLGPGSARAASVCVLHRSAVWTAPPDAASRPRRPVPSRSLGRERESTAASRIEDRGPD